MQVLNQPLMIFTTQKRFNDRTADDMKYGDFDMATLKSRFHLDQVSTYIDWATYRPSYKHPSIRNIPAVSKEKAIAMLFDELRGASRLFSFRGPYQGLIVDLFSHMQHRNGTDFQDVRLNQAYKSLIENDKESSSILSRIKNTLDTFDFNSSKLTKDDFSLAFKTAHLPKYVRWKDWINGLGITVHDINSTEISIESLSIHKNKYTVTVKFVAQDHFGLDSDDISKIKFNSITFFRIWFVLQRYNKFSYKPFFTNFEAQVTISGDIYD